MEYSKHELGIEHTTVVNFNNYLREICASDLLANPLRIGGPGMNVEIDESQFSKRKNNQGRHFPPQWVFGGICRETGDSFLYAVDNRSAANLIPIIRDAILPGSTVFSDE